MITHGVGSPVYKAVHRVLDGPDRVSSLPRLNRVFYIKNLYDSASGKFLDRDGANERTLYQLQYIQSAGGLDLAHASIVGTETVISKQGTATITVAAGKLTVGTGTLWSFVLSNGSQYEYAAALSSTTGVVWDVSGNGRHLLFTVGNTSAVCLSGRQYGSDWLNQKGWSIYPGAVYDIKFSDGSPVYKYQEKWADGGYYGYL